MTYVVSDIHGMFDSFMELLNKIDFKTDDTLYVLGDAIDRGPEPIKTLQYIMNTPNIKFLLGNHEEMFLYSVLYDEDDACWMNNGGHVTWTQFNQLTKKEQQELLVFLKKSALFELIKIKDIPILLTHAGVYPYESNTIKELILEQTRDDFLWVRTHFISNPIKLPVKIIFGHTPSPLIKKELDSFNKFQKYSFHPKNITYQQENDSKIIYFNNKIGIDCAAAYGRYLGCLRLEDNKEFYVDTK